MENSIEDTIKTIEKMIKSYKEADVCGLSNNDFKNEIKALEHILSDYKRVLQENEYMHNELDKQQTTINKYAKENEELKKFLRMGSEVAENSILIPKIKCKIEELDIAISECEYSDDDDEKYKKAVEKDKLCLLNQKRALQELLESEE